MITIGKQFIEMTKYQNILEESDQHKQIPQPMLESEVTGKKDIKLQTPDFNRFGNISLTDAIARRKSIRDYSNEKVNSVELSYLLWCTQGVKQIIGKNQATLRTVPSAGARHAFETYVFVNHMEDVAEGLYKYKALPHELTLIRDENNLREKLLKACLSQNFILTSSVIFIWVAVPYRMTWRYQERGYRYIFLDAGHVCQNLYLAAQEIGCGVCAIAAFDDDEVNKLLNLDGKEQTAIYLAAVGKSVSH
jgi:SagB-type dehydrogenase family enzyme